MTTGTRQQKRNAAIYKNALDFLDDIVVGATCTDIDSTDRANIASFLVNHLSEIAEIEEERLGLTSIIYRTGEN